MSDTLKKAIGIGASALAGAFVGSKYTENKIRREQENAKPDYQYRYAPALIQGSSIQEWESYKRQYMSKYGNTILGIAERRIKSLSQALDKLKKQNPEYAKMFDIIVPFDHQAMMNSLVPPGMKSADSGKQLNLFSMALYDDFTIGGRLGTNYALKSAIRNSVFLPNHGIEVLFDPDHKPLTMTYIKQGNALIENALDELCREIAKETKLQVSTNSEEMLTEKFYLLRYLQFTNLGDIRDII